MSRIIEPGLMNRDLPSESIIPAVNVKETRDDFQIEVAAPGLQKDDFEISYEKEQLCIAASVKKGRKEDEDNYLSKEYIRGSFQRTFHLPEKLIDADKIKARYELGILHINLPKKEEFRPKPAKKVKIS
jgi:HSP20 family protein